MLAVPQEFLIPHTIPNLDGKGATQTQRCTNKAVLEDVSRKESFAVPHTRSAAPYCTEESVLGSASTILNMSNYVLIIVQSLHYAQGLYNFKSRTS